MASTRTFTVSAPASSGNLGPGFDVFAMALELRNELRVSAGTGNVDVRGEGADALPTDATNLVVRALETTAGSTLAELGIDLRCTNRIPLARGLGSSTAAAACGIIAAWELKDTDWDDDALELALTTMDGHPDNAAACAYGGIVLCHDRVAVGDDPAELDVIPLGVADWIAPLLVIPDRELVTAESRAALPTSYAREDVVRAIGSAALMSAGLVGGHVELLEDALGCDVIHEPHRAALVPELAEVRDALADTSALGATLSGAGPTVLVWCQPDTVVQAVGSLAIDFPHHRVEAIPMAAEGARVDR